MSGGKFNYNQYMIEEIRDQIVAALAEEEDLKQETVEKFHEAIKTLSRAFIMAHRIDWFLCYDDGEESFNRRWDEDLAALEYLAELEE